MKRRLNPETGKPFRHGDVDAEGKIFWGYKNGVKEYWLTKEKFDAALLRNRKKVDERLETWEGHISNNLSSIRSRCKRKGIPFNLDMDHIKEILTADCPVFNTPLIFGVVGRGHDEQSPSLDRVIPELGYVKGNVVFISKIANTIKQNVTEKEIYAVADWLYYKRKEVEDVFKNELARISKERAEKSKRDTELGAIHGAGVGEDCDGAHHHRGEPEGEDTSCGAEESCRICMGSGVRQVEALKLYESCEDYGLTEAEVRGLKQLFGCVCH
mgnify:CR=1 FL=1